MTTDLVTVLEDLGIVVVSPGREIACQCPFHADSHPSFSMNRQTGLWICYQCSRAGTLDMLIKELGGQEGSAVEVLRDIRRKKIEKPDTARAVSEEPPPPDPLLIQARYESYGEPPDWAVGERHIARQVAVEYGVKWDHGWIIPIWSPSAALLGWQYKRLDVVANWPKQIKKSTTLFGLRELAANNIRTVALVESPLDVCRLATCGVAAVAAFGAFVSRTQLQLLVEHADRVVLALDNDHAGKEQGHKIYPYLARHLPTWWLKYPDDVKDPGDMSDDQIAEAFA